MADLNDSINNIKQIIIKIEGKTGLFVLAVFIIVVIFISIAAWWIAKTLGINRKQQPDENFDALPQTSVPNSQISMTSRYVSVEELKSSLMKLRTSLLERIIKLETAPDILNETLAKMVERQVKELFSQNTQINRNTRHPGVNAHKGSKPSWLMSDDTENHQVSSDSPIPFEQLENIVREQVRYHLNSDNFKQLVTEQVELWLKQNGKIKEIPSFQPTVQKQLNANGTRVSRFPQPKPDTVANRQIPEDRDKSARQKTPAPVADGNGINEIKTLLLSMGLVDETALNIEDTNVKAGEFVENVVAKCLKLNQPLTQYQRLDNGIQEITRKEVSLILPNSGDEFNPNEHNAVVQQTASKGKLNVVASLTRPGVKCNNMVKRKAEVVQTV